MFNIGLANYHGQYVLIIREGEVIKQGYLWVEEGVQKINGTICQFKVKTINAMSNPICIYVY